MKITVFSLFPEILLPYFESSIMARAAERGIINWKLVNIRDYAADKHKTCDDAPYGGGAGMLMKAQPICEAFKANGVEKKDSRPISGGSRKRARVVYLSPSGSLFNQARALELSLEEELAFLCGRYEGVDQRVIDLYADDEISLGDYVLSSGEIAALAVIDAVYRLADGVIRPLSLSEESFTGGLLEYPQWTRPDVYDSVSVPEVLLSGNHESIRKWRLRESVKKTIKTRPDLLKKGVKNGVFNAETIQIIECFTQKTQPASRGGCVAQGKGVCDE
ncbi:MAG: tRNA (guanosine(37)-N1)-methyltransferase TrmD [Spirochaetaceae bacterium]|jgi:tRNA (guanine37-N1)-methyltransferase|nr:tRNA (guanosine(37)-N1)-methyltransferase TrmD [Spirochaetaceae bacterium]